MHKHSGCVLIACPLLQGVDGGIRLDTIVSNREGHSSGSTKRIADLFRHCRFVLLQNDSSQFVFGRLGRSAPPGCDHPGAHRTALPAPMCLSRGE